ncbi:MAG: HEAT repeat domain-containing protein [Cyanobacteria bacterium J06623_7]
MSIEPDSSTVIVVGNYQATSIMDRDLSQLKLNLRNHNIYQRKLALDELATIPSEAALPILQELLESPDFALRRIAVMGLGNHVTEASFKLLTKILGTEQDANVLAEAANSIFEFGDRSILPLKQLFANSDSWLVRQTVISILVDSDNPQILLEIAQLAIADDDQTTKETGILALSRLLNTPLKPEALNVFSRLSKAKYWRTRWRVAIALTASDDPQARKLLSKLQQDEHYRVVAAALEQPR